MNNIPGFLSNQPMRGDMPSRGAGGRNFGSNSGKRKSGDSNGWFEFKEIMDVIQHHQHQRDGLEPSPIQPFFHQLFHTDTPLLVLHPV